MKPALAALLLALTLSCAAPAPSPAPAPSKEPAPSGPAKIPVVFDTDLCDDIDDTWALIMLLNSPEFDIRLITTSVGDTRNKARCVAKLLEIAGRTDIPVGIGVPGDLKWGHRQDAWIGDYKLESYPGKIHEDGVQAMIDTLMNAKGRMLLMAIGPLPNVAAALDREPRIAGKCEFIGMHGSVRVGYNGKTTPDAEYNVKAFVKEAQKSFAAGWEMTITPLDTCGIVRLGGRKYKKLLRSDRPLARALVSNYAAWLISGKMNMDELGVQSSILFDTVAVYLGFSTDLLKMERLGIRVDDRGFTVEDPAAKKINCAMDWKNLEAFEDLVVERIIR